MAVKIPIFNCNNEIKKLSMRTSATSYKYTIPQDGYYYLKNEIETTSYSGDIIISINALPIVSKYVAANELWPRVEVLLYLKANAVVDFAKPQASNDHIAYISAVLYQ